MESRWRQLLDGKSMIDLKLVVVNMRDNIFVYGVSKAAVAYFPLHKFQRFNLLVTFDTPKP